MNSFYQIVLVGFGSALGGLARWGVTLYAGRWLGTAFPWGTLIINLTGSFFLGWFSGYLTNHLAEWKDGWLHADNLKLTIAVGFTGAYTTFSTFELETHGLLRSGESLKGMTYLMSSVVLGLIAVRAGIVLADWK